MNILISSVGRRNYIVDYFKKAVGNEGQVFVSNSLAFTSGMFAGDVSIVSPPIISKEYIPFLLDSCVRNNIKAIVPLFDMDLSALSYNKSVFKKHDILPIVSEYDFVNKCFDKLCYTDFLAIFGLKTPVTTNNLSYANDLIEIKEIKFPLILKPRWGTGSISTKVVSDMKSLHNEYTKLSKEVQSTYINTPVPEGHQNTILIQEMIEGDEYGLDVINDLNGNYQTTWVKKKFGMRSGETDGAVTIKNNILEICGQKIGKTSKHIGILDVDVILSNDGVPYVIDINPRFGGGYPFSHVAGVDLPKAIIKWIKGEALTNELIIEENITSVKGITLIKKR
jgi:carbamoyl-phosphate synthase large subunit